MGILRAEDRREAPRRPLDEIPRITGVRISAEEVTVINASRTGILVEGRLRFNLGMENAVEVRHEGSPLRIRGRVVRCELKRLESSGPRYEVAIAFDQPVQIFDVAPTVLTVFDLQDIDLAGLDPSLARNDW